MSNNIFNDLYNQVFNFEQEESSFFKNLIKYLEPIHLEELNEKVQGEFTKFQIKHKVSVGNGYVMEDVKNNDAHYKTRLRSIQRYLVKMLDYLYTFENPSAPPAMYDGIMLGKIRIFCEISKTLISKKVVSHSNEAECSCRTFSIDHVALLRAALPIKKEMVAGVSKRSKFEQSRCLSMSEKIHSNWNQLSRKNKAVFLGVLALQVVAIITLAVILPGSPLVTVAGGAFLSLKILSGMAVGASLTAQVTYGCYRLFNKKTAVLKGADAYVDRISFQNSGRGTDL